MSRLVAVLRACWTQDVTRVSGAELDAIAERLARRPALLTRGARRGAQPPHAAAAAAVASSSSDESDGDGGDFDGDDRPPWVPAGKVGPAVAPHREHPAERAQAQAQVSGGGGGGGSGGTAFLSRYEVDLGRRAQYCARFEQHMRGGVQ